LPEIAVCAVNAAIAAALLIFAPGFFKIVAVIPVTMLALVLSYGNLGKAWATWKKAAQIIVMPIGLFFLTLGFVCGVGLTRLITSIFKVRMLDMKFDDRKSYWIERPRKEITLEKAERQF
jgi:uncharacterized membrane protein